jgi:hypothetical protein
MSAGRRLVLMIRLTRNVMPNGAWSESSWRGPCTFRRDTSSERASPRPGRRLVDGFALPLIHLRIESNEPQSAYATNVCSREKRTYGLRADFAFLPGCMVWPCVARGSGPLADDRLHTCESAPLGSRRKRGEKKQAVGRSRGGRNTKIHALADAKGLHRRRSTRLRWR